MADQHVALCVLLELAVQHGSLSHILKAVLLLLSLWNYQSQQSDNRVSCQGASAPLLPLLKRFGDVLPAKCVSGVQASCGSHRFVCSPTRCFLRFLTLPDDDSLSVDLQQAAVVIMSHLDRLAMPFSPPSHNYSKVINLINYASVGACVTLKQVEKFKFSLSMSGI